MFEEEDKEEGSPSVNWWTGVRRSRQQQSPPPPRKQLIHLECDPSVENLTESTVRFVAHPSGTDLQVNNSEPRGIPRVSLHQNHYATTRETGSTLGILQIGSRDKVTASLSGFVDGPWSSTSNPTGVAVRVTPHGSAVPRYPVLTMRADGRVSLGGGPSSLGNSLVSLGVYRRGIFELPSVDRYEDLSTTTSAEPFVNGAIVYARNLDRVLISQGGEWHAILTTPASQLLSMRPPPPPSAAPTAAPRPSSSDSSVTAAACTWVAAAGGYREPRSIGAPRRDGRPTIFGPRTCGASS